MRISNQFLSGSALYHGLNNARKFAAGARSDYLAISEMFGKEKVLEWSKQSRVSRLVNGEWVSVYRHPKSKSAPM
jgi:hypothetical protein